MSALAINCGTHGSRTSAVVCRHHIESKMRMGFVENSDDPENLQAWCLECEKMFVREGSLTPTFREFNSFAVVCVDCYAELKARHLTH